MIFADAGTGHETLTPPSNEVPVGKEA